MVKLLDPMWTERASLSLNKQMRKQDLPHPSLDLYLWDHTMGFSIQPSYQSSLVCGFREKKREAWEMEDVVRKVTWLCVSRA